MTEEMQRRARQMMAEASATGFGGAEPTPLVSVPDVAPAAMDIVDAGRIVSMTFMSRTGGERPHIVTIGYNGVVTCTCQAVAPCWAQKAFHRATGR